MSIDLYHTLMDLPDAEEVVDRARKQLEREGKERQAFRDWLTPSVKAEYINGEIVMHSPVKRAHLVASGNLFMLLQAYVIKHQLGTVAAEKALVELGRNDFEPDLCFWTQEKTADWTDDMMVHPAPDLVVEILSKSTATNDRGIKFQAYQTYRVQEYLIVDPMAKTVEQYILGRNTDDTYTYKLTDTFKGASELELGTISGLIFPAEAVFDERRCQVVVADLLRAD